MAIGLVAFLVVAGTTALWFLRMQQVRMDGHTIASDLLNPDWIKLAESFGVAGHRAESPEAERRRT